MVYFSQFVFPWLPFTINRFMRLLPCTRACVNPGDEDVNQGVIFSALRAFAVWQERQTEQIMTNVPCHVSVMCYGNVSRAMLDLAWDGLSKGFWGRRRLRQSESRVAVSRWRTGGVCFRRREQCTEERKKHCLLKTKQQQPKQSGRRPEVLDQGEWMGKWMWNEKKKKKKKPARARSQGPQRAE